jgi:hypothetical protein
MAAPPARARADYDYLIKLLLIGDSGELAEPLAPLPPCRPSICARSGCFGIVLSPPCDLAFQLGSGTQISVCADGCAKCEWANEFNHWTAGCYSCDVHIVRVIVPLLALTKRVEKFNCGRTCIDRFI